MKCSRCQGTGIVSAFVHVQGGHCFHCDGTGIEREAKNKKSTGITKEQTEEQKALFLEIDNVHEKLKTLKPVYNDKTIKLRRLYRDLTLFKDALKRYEKNTDIVGIDALNDTKKCIQLVSNDIAELKRDSEQLRQQIDSLTNDLRILNSRY